jgi:hypothetical protein
MKFLINRAPECQYLKFLAFTGLKARSFKAQRLKTIFYHQDKILNFRIGIFGLSFESGAGHTPDLGPKIC